MKKTIIALFLIISLISAGCTSNRGPILKGTYQSEHTGDGYVIQLAFRPDDNSFVEYIDNREVDKGIFEKGQNNSYDLKSEKQSFEIILNNEDSFSIMINKLNGGKPIQLTIIDKTPTYLSTSFDDVEAYKKLLEKE